MVAAGIALTTVAILLLVGPVFAAPASAVLGTPDSEGPGHVVALALSLIGGNPWLLPEVPGALNPIRANITPMATLLGWPFYAALGGLRGAALAWNAQWLVVSLAGSVGAWLFVRDWLGAAAPAAVAAALVASATSLHELPAVGRLEELALYAWPLHVALLYRAVVLRPGWPSVAAAAVSFASIAVEGGFASIYLACVEVPLAAALLRAAPDRRRAAQALSVVALAGILALAPFVWAHLEYPSPPQVHPHRGKTVVGLAQLLPGGGNIPWRQGYHVRPYPGLALLSLAALAALVDRRARPWLLGGLTVLVLSLGPTLVWTPDSEAIVSLPARWIGAAIPSLPMTAWNRMGALIVPMLAFSGAALAARWRWTGWILLLAAVEHLAEGRPSGTRSWGIEPPPALAAALYDGGLVQLPDDDLAMLWQHSVPAGQPAEPIFPDEPVLLAWLRSLAPTPVTKMRTRLPATTNLDPTCVAFGAETLRGAGFQTIALRTDDVAPEAAARIDRTLTLAPGPPRRASGVTPWPPTPRFPGEACP
ncbi:hypothetical protein LBMAG42_34580 [Deltaproteobacteria bacterium]|nr:hypothetical protein LBMAG42_34580 [Deltaproteobacteria bacterium]